MTAARFFSMLAFIALFVFGAVLLYAGIQSGDNVLLYGGVVVVVGFGAGGLLFGIPTNDGTEFFGMYFVALALLIAWQVVTR